jgi:HEAT repeat protein
MDTEEFAGTLAVLPPQEKIRLIYTHLDDLPEPDKIRVLLSLLKDEKSSAKVRATALKFLRQTSYQDAELFQRYLDDGNPAVASAARAAAREAGEQEQKNRLIAESVLKKIQATVDRDKKIKILKAIARLQAPWVEHVLLEALADSLEAIRDFLVQELSGRERLSLALFQKRLMKPPWYARSAALKILGMKRIPESLKIIESVLEDANADVRRNVAWSLSEIGGKEVVPLLVRLSKDSNHYVRITAEEALRKVSEVRFS